jgi:hypothetical protein
LQRSWPQSMAQGKTLAKLSLEGTSEGIRLLHKESWCVSLVDATRTGTEAIEVAISAGSRPNCAANDPARIPAKGTAVVEAAGCCTKTAACTGDAARTETPTRRILGATGPGARGTVYAPRRITNSPAGAAGSSTNVAPSGGQWHLAWRNSNGRPKTSSRHPPSPSVKGGGRQS